MRDAIENGNPNMVIALVGNKTDLEAKRMVSAEEGQRFARENNMIYMETSAKLSHNVEPVFIETGKMIYQKIQAGNLDMASETSGVRMGPSAGRNVKINGKTNKKKSGCC